MADQRPKDAAFLPQAWQPGLQRLAKSFSREKLAPLARVSDTLSDVKRNGEHLMLTAQSQVAKLNENTARLAGDLSVLASRGEGRPSRLGGLRKSSSEANLQRAGHGSSRSARQSSRLGSGWPIPRRRTTHASDAEALKAQDSRPRSLDDLLASPLQNAQETLGHCQKNLATLGEALAEHKATLETRLATFARERAAACQPWLRASASSGALASLAGAGPPAPPLPPPPWRGVREGAAAVLEGGERSGASSTGAGSAAPPARARGGSSLRDPGRRITIVTTASLPWMTGTAVNPLLRAAYLARDASRAVTLMVPWLAPADQARVFPGDLSFDSPAAQEAWVRAWVRKRTGFDSDFRLTFYPARYAPEKCSILPVGDPTRYVPDHEADVAVLEEPEHLNWYHHGARWSDKFRHVVGVMHTNYLDYARREEHGWAKELVLKHVNRLVCRAHCHKVVKLSDAVQSLPREVTEFVHGVPDAFLAVGRASATGARAAPGSGGEGAEGVEPGAGEGAGAGGGAPAASGGSAGSPAARFSRGAYFIGKVVWGKGYTELLDLVSQAGPALEGAPLDCYGTGEDAEEVAARAAKQGLPLAFHGARDHLDPSIHDYRCFVNPSTSDVVATTTAEALAMGKWVVCADLPCNAFFTQFKNCLIYRTPDEFARHVRHAMTQDPAPLPEEDARRLSWEAATERFLDVSELREEDLARRPLDSALDRLAYAAHNSLTGVEGLRAAAGAGAGTRDNPQRLDDYDPALSLRGGIFDSKKRAGGRAEAVTRASA
ncbi:DGD1 [Auxenochlorella protothecoides x Auxenochlorella symbiontica]|uniref:Digalactosyldiacylglycerol synthase n=2 Tax=Auxenochlorella protothecoides TaxID=3075 RepID=A0A1D1ZY81_AUXPR